MPIRNVPFSTPKQVKPSGLIPKHKQPFSLSLFSDLAFFQTMKTHHFIRILELKQTKRVHSRLTDRHTNNEFKMRTLPED